MIQALLIVAVVVLWIQLSAVKKELRDLERRFRERPSPPPESYFSKPEALPSVQNATAPAAVAASPALSEPQPAERAPMIREAAEPVESRITGRWFAAVGIIALLCGLGFFLKYAFDQNLITQTGRVILGIVLGFVFVGVGDFLSRRPAHREYSFFVSGGGLAILYFSIYSAFGFYHLIPQSAAFLGMALVTAIGALLSITEDTVVLAGMALFGGFLAPYIVSSGTDNQVALFSYITILDLGFLALCYFRSWYKLYPIVFVGTYTLFFGWMAAFYNPSLFWPTFLYLTLYFLIFLAAPLLRSFLRKERVGQNEAFFLAVNATAYFATVYGILGANYGALRGAFFACWGIFFLALAWSLRLADREDKTGIWTLAGVGLMLITLAVPIQLQSFWVTMAWALEALLLAAIGTGLGLPLLRGYGHLVSLAVLLRLLVRDSFPFSIAEAVPFWNGRFYTYIVVVAALALIAYCYGRKEEQLPPEERLFKPLYAAAAVFAALIGIYIEISAFALPAAWVPFSWILGSFALITGGWLMKSRGMRITGIALYAVAVIRLIVIEQFSLPGAAPLVFNQRFGLFLLAALAAYAFASLYQSRKGEMPEDEQYLPAAFGVAANILTVWALSLEVTAYFDRFAAAGAIENQKNLSLSVLWGVYAGVLMLVGITRHMRSIRILGLCGIGIVIIKVFIYDAASLSDIYRVASFVTLGVILLVISFIFYRYKDKIREFLLA